MSQWRVIMTDTEGATGVAPVCDKQDDPNGLHADPFDETAALPDWVFDCCPHPHLQCWTESAAASQAATLTAYDAEPCS